MHLFQSGSFVLTSGKESNFKIECDALTPDDWTTLAWIVFERSSSFREVIGVPRGGLPFAAAFHCAAHDTCAPYLPRLVVDAVWTTGASILKLMRPDDFGWVVFARSPIPERFPVRALFTLADVLD